MEHDCDEHLLPKMTVMGTHYGNRVVMGTCRNRMTGSNCKRRWLGDQEYEDSGYRNRIVMGTG
jgi:hypothetical protein